MKNILFVLLFFVAIKTYGTAQAADIIIFNGKEYFLFTNPLEKYFEEHPDKRPKRGNFLTALMRGYIATFEFKDNELILKDIEIYISDSLRENEPESEWVSVLDEVFPNQEVLKIDWWTGLLVLPFGEVINCATMGYGSTYENYILIEINSGNLIKSLEMNYIEYEIFKEKQFEEFKKTDKYKEIFEKLKKYDYPNEEIDDFIKLFESDYLTKILTE